MLNLTHWGRVTHICVGKLTIIGSDNGLSPGRRQTIIWTNAGILLIGPLGTNFSEILIAIQTFTFKKMHLKMSSAKWRLFCLGLNELTPGFNRLIEDNCKRIQETFTFWELVRLIQEFYGSSFTKEGHSKYSLSHVNEITKQTRQVFDIESDSRSFSKGLSIANRFVFNYKIAYELVGIMNNDYTVYA